MVFARLLGQPAIRYERNWLEPPAGRTSALLYYLAYKRTWVSRDELLYLLWPDILEQKARRNLSRRLVSIKSLPYTNTLEVETNRLRWQLPSDSADFREAITGERFSHAVQVYQGVLLEGFNTKKIAEFDTWLGLERQHLHKHWQDAVLNLALELEKKGRYADAANVLAHLLEVEPFNEAVVQKFLVYLQQAGETKKALDAFRQFQQVLHHELGVQPEKATLELIYAIEHDRPLPGIFTDTWPTVLDMTETDGATQPLVTLPTQATAFVGRQREIEQVTKKLSNTSCRLLTIVGVGGTGKTRLAIEVAREQLSSFPDGTFFVTLFSVSAPQSMVSAIADTIRFTLVGSRDPKLQLFDYLKDKTMLLVLDNLEHLLEGAMFIAELLEQAPKLNILATSRERLNLHAEWLYDLGGLNYPEGEFDNPTNYDAIQLFVQSAKKLLPDASLGDDMTKLVAQICQAVEGMPLALELAAGWLSSMTLADIVQEANAELKTHVRDMPERHQSIYGVFEHSWRLLSEKEQMVVRKLAVFRGGFRRETAAAVAGASFEVLSRLVNKSFLRLSSEGRYTRHPLILQYSQAKLAESAEQSDTQDQHSSYYLDVLEAHYQKLFIEAKSTIQFWHEDLENVRVAWRTAVFNRDAEAVRCASYPFRVMLMFKRKFLEAKEDYALAISAFDEPNQYYDKALATLQVDYAELGLWSGLDFNEAEDLATTGVNQLRLLGERHALARGLVTLLRYPEDFEGSRAIYDDAIVQCQALAEPEKSVWQAECARWWAFVEEHYGTIEQHLRFNQKALDLYRKVNYSLGIIEGYNGMGWAYLHAQKPIQALKQLQQGRKFAQALGVKDILTNYLAVECRVAYELADYPRAESLCKQLLKMSEQSGDTSFRLITKMTLGRTYTMQGEHDKAAKVLIQCLQTAKDYGGVDTVYLECLTYFAELKAQQNKLLEACMWTTLILHHPSIRVWDIRNVEQLLQKLKGQLSDKAFAKAQIQGRDLKLEDVVEELVTSSL